MISLGMIPLATIPLAVERVPFVFGPGEAVMVALATIIIFGILGPRMLRDIRRSRSS